jgi:subtilisin
VDWVTAHAATIEVANMSLGGPEQHLRECGPKDSDALHEAICASVRAGVTYVVAAGNEAQDASSFGPALYPEVITVAGMSDDDGLPGGLGGPFPSGCELPDADDSAASFSNWGAPVDVAAPASCIGSTYIGSTYAIASGTSLAAPLVTGTVSLCIASGACAGLTAAQIVEKIRSDTATYNAANPDYGFTGDPLHSLDPNRYYGYLIRAGLY